MKQDTSIVAAALERTLARMPLSDDPGSNAWKRLHEEPDFTKLLETFREIPQLGVFDGQLQFVPGQASRVKYETLGTWLLERAREIGSTEAVNDLSKFIEANEIPFQRFSAVEGLRLQRRCNVQPGVHLLSWTDVNQTKSMRYIEEFWHRQFRFPTAAVVRDLKEPKELFFAPDSDSNPIFELRFDDPELILCAGLFGPAAPVVLASWVELPTWFPRSGVSWSFTGPTDSSQDRGWPENAYEEFPRLYQKLKSLHMPEQEHLRVPLDRLNKAMRRSPSADAAIDLGIALEALFLSDLEDDRGELSFRLRVRGARYLGDSVTERSRISKELRSLYTARSIAVHTGILPEKIGGIRVKNLLERGYEHAAAAIRSMIENGQPNWDEVIFS